MRKIYSNWGEKHKNRTRCNKCHQRITLFIFKQDGLLYCSCPKCGAKGRFIEK